MRTPGGGTIRHVSRALLAISGVYVMLGTGVTASNAQAPAGSPAARILVGPDFRVNRESDAPHFETAVATDPTRPRNLIGASIAEPGGRSVAWHSDDGGFLWRHIVFPGEPAHQRMYASGDPQVAFTNQGTALFATMSLRPQAKHGRGIDIFRSPNGGVTWDTAFFVFGDYSVDHPQLGTDGTRGKFAGRSYLTFEHAPYPEYDIDLVRSTDDGRTWDTPRRIVSSPPSPDGGMIHGVNTLNPLVLRDGTLFLPFSRFDFDTSGGRLGSGTGAVISHDGGETFGPHIEVFPMAEEQRSPRTRGDFSLVGSAPQFAVDTTSGPFGDRLYAVVTRPENGRLRLMISTSSDRGQHWSSRRPVTTQIPTDASQFQPAIAVNNRGTVGIIWFDTRRWPKRDRFDVYFTASIDGGDSFLPSERINSAPSIPRGAGNLAPTSGSEGNEVLKDPIVISSMYSYRSSGGDYIGMAADVDGVFHPFWPDARTGTYHVWTARIEISTEPLPKVPVNNPASMVSLKDKAVLIADPGFFDESSGEFVLPMRIKNISGEDLAGPIRVTIVRAWEGLAKVADDPRSAPMFTNAMTSADSRAPLYDYSTVLGPRSFLRPGDVSGAVLWRIRFPARVQRNFLRLTTELTGIVMHAPGRHE